MSVNFKGRDYKLYFAATAPTPTTISTQYTLVGNLTTVSISTSRNAIDVSTKDSGDNTDVIAVLMHQQVRDFIGGGVGHERLPRLVFNADEE
jgi:hypothetical protein